MYITQNTDAVKNNHQSQITHYLSDAQIAARYGVSRQTVWRWTSNDPKFPTPIKLSAGCTRWRLSDLEAWELAK